MELCGVENKARSERSRCVRIRPLSKRCRSRFAEICSETEFLVPRAKHIALIDVTPHQGRSTHDSLPVVEGSLSYSRFEGDPTDKNSVSPPVARQEQVGRYPLPGQEKLYD